MRGRNANIEVLRCFLMFSIVFGHCCCHGAYAKTSVGLVLGTMTVFAVDAFALISGWFSVRPTPQKMLRFLGLGLFAWCVIMALTFVMSHGEGVCWRALEMGWYGNGYLTVMLFAPFLNAGVDFVFERGGICGGWQLLCCCLGFMFLMWLPLPDIGIKLVWGWHAHSSFLLMIMYITGRVCSKIERLKTIRVNHLILVFCACEMLTLGWAAVTRWQNLGWFGQIKFWDNQSPAQVTAALALFLLFFRLRFPEWLKKVCIYGAPSMFVIYLLHDTSCAAPVVQPLYTRLELYVNSFGVGSGLAIFVAAVVVYVSGLVIDIVFRRVLWNRLREGMLCLLQKMCVRKPTMKVQRTERDSFLHIVSGTKKLWGQ